MKLAVILLSCLVGLSYQQNYGLWTPSLGHRAALYQNLDADQFIRPSVLQPFDSQDLAGVNGKEDAISVIQGRVPAKWNAQPQGRLFFLGNLFPNQITSTVTQYTTVTTVVVNSCIPGAYFVAGAAACPARKKRDIEDVGTILPSQVERMEVSAEPRLLHKRYDDQSEITSSFQSFQDFDSNPSSGSLRPSRAFNLLNTVRTVTTTSVVYTGTTINKLIFTEPADSAKCGSGSDSDCGVLPCKPDGIAIC